MRGKCAVFALLMGLSLAGRGIQESYTALFNSSPTVVTHDDYVKTKPGAEWLDITEARKVPLEAVYIEKEGEIKDVWIPVRSVHHDDTSTVHIMLHTDNEAVLAAMRRMRAMRQTSPLAPQYVQGVAALTAAVDALEIKGVLEFGLDRSSRDTLEGTTRLGAGWIVIAQGKEPNLRDSAGKLIGGLALLGLLGLMLRGSAEKEPANQDVPNDGPNGAPAQPTA